MLEPYDGKLSRTVLRRESGSNPADLVDYGRETLRRLGADDEILEVIDGYTDFEQLGRAMMEEDGVRQTSFGMVRRLSRPFPEQSEMGMQMQ